MVDLKTNGIYGLVEQCISRKLFCFGAGKHFDTVMNLYKTYGLVTLVGGIIDNNQQLSGTKRKYEDREFLVYDIDGIEKEMLKEPIVILITCHIYSMDIVEQLDRCVAFENIPVYIGSFLSDDLDYKGNYYVETNEIINIPKIIHYCWFGGEKIPDEYQKYMRTWREQCPEYEIRRWDESNFDINQNLYMKQAYSVKKWAFVSDYARIKILHDEGGIYLDCDVELIKNFENFLGDSFYCGFEDANHINFGLGFGSVKGHPILKQLISMYEEKHFLNDDGTMDMTPCTAYQTECIRKFGFIGRNSFQRKNGAAIYPTEVLAPISPWGVDHRNESAYSVHHYSASWQTDDKMASIMKMYSRYYNCVTGKKFKKAF